MSSDPAPPAPPVSPSGPPAVVTSRRVVPVSDEEQRLITDFYKDHRRRWVRSEGFVQPPAFARAADALRDLRVRATDVWVVSFSRSGTTWLQELAWLVASGLDWSGARASPLHERFAFIEYPTMARDSEAAEGAGAEGSSSSSSGATRFDYRSLEALPSPRFIKTHLPLSLLPPALLDTAKVLYVARDPRDVCVSFFFMHKLFRYCEPHASFDHFWQLFKNDLVMHAPPVAHAREAWDVRSHRNMLFLFYEDMQRDLSSVVDRVGEFLGRPVPASARAQLLHHLSFASMSRSMSIGRSRDDRPAPRTDADAETDADADADARAHARADAGELKFFRKGKAGAWPEYFVGPARREAELYLQRRLEGSDLRYPSPQPDAGDVIAEA